MATLQDRVALVSSILLRIASYVFLRWIPGHHLLPVIWTLAAVYLPSFIASLLTQQPYEIVDDEIDVTIEEKVVKQSPPEFASTAAHSHNLRGAEKPKEVEGEVVDVTETIVLKGRSAKPQRTILTGLPSPTSPLLSLITFLINLALVASVVDLVYRARTFYPSHDLSFARLGYVSTNEAKLLIREPHPSKLPITVSYRVVTPGALNEDPFWQPAGTVSVLAYDTDFTGVFSIQLPNYPDRKYQWRTSNNHTGFFSIPPRPGIVPSTGFTFLTSSCIKPKFPYNPLDHPLSIPGFRHLSKVIGSIPGGAQFMLFLGDFIYIDVPKRFGTSTEDYRREYRQVYASPDWPSVGQNLSWIHVLDDHEIANDWDSSMEGLYDAAVDPWHHYQTSVNPPRARGAGVFHRVRDNATYFEFTQGPASFFMLDTRSYRDPSGSISPGEAANSTTKSMLGAQQKADFLAFLARTEPRGVKWKIVASSIPFTKNWHVNSVDTWAGYLSERRDILEAMWDVGSTDGVGVVVLSGDRHEFAATAFPPPPNSKWPISATVHEFSTSPLSQFYLPVPTYKQKDDEDVMIKYIPLGNSKVGAITIEEASTDQSSLKFRLYVDGMETWSSVLLSPPVGRGSRRSKDALWG
ncbi:alkaline phosphatase family protein-like protein [Calycina marina]|uniref:Alkaline phosphatase family protein-like protein n=1 Tax=Calycina marina TaxID=1763456 RepID=A0A9P7Z408_9HELO|nr:alkaline phosphatase family protein-like protein [Calycina marina]